MSTTYTHDHVFAAGEVGCVVCRSAHREDCDCERCQPVFKPADCPTWCTEHMVDFVDGSNLGHLGYLPGVSAPEAGIRLGIDSATGVAFVDPEVVAGNMWTPAEARRFAADLLRATDVLDPSPRSDRAICPSWCESHTQIDEADSAAGFIHEHQVTVGEVSLVLCAASFQPDADNAGESKATWYVDMLPEYQWLDGQAVLDYAEALRQAYELGSPQSGDPWRRAVRQAGCITQEVPAL